MTYCKWYSWYKIYWYPNLKVYLITLNLTTASMGIKFDLLAKKLCVFHTQSYYQFPFDQKMRTKIDVALQCRRLLIADFLLGNATCSLFSSVATAQLLFSYDPLGHSYDQWLQLTSMVSKLQYKESLSSLKYTSCFVSSSGCCGCSSMYSDWLLYINTSSPQAHQSLHVKRISSTVRAEQIGTRSD